LSPTSYPQISQTSQKWKRLAVLYAPKKDGGIERSTSPAQDSFKKKPVLLLGGAGLVSTIEDYSRFYMTLLNDGQLDGVRLEIGRTHAKRSSRHARTRQPRRRGGFGLAFSVNLGPGRSPEVGSRGTYSWGGAAGTSFWIDPQEHMFGIFLIQVLPPTGIPAAEQFRRLAYLALE